MEVERVEGAGHFSPQEKPQLIAERAKTCSPRHLSARFDRAEVDTASLPMNGLAELARAAVRYRPRPAQAVATALRQRATLAETAHRPWPPPGRGWFMGQSWRHLLFAHWRVDSEALRRLVPSQLELDLHDGEAWLGVTPFRVEGFRLRRTLPPPLISRFLEVNVRTYVKCEGKPGIYFLSLDTDSRLAVAGARRTYRLPYFHAAQSLSETRRIHFQSTRISADAPAAELDCAFMPAGEHFEAKPGSLDYWLTERYCLYTLAEGGTVQRAGIHHRPWQLQPASATFELNSMASGYGLDLVGTPLLHYSEIQDVVLWTIWPISGS